MISHSGELGEDEFSVRKCDAAGIQEERHGHFQGTIWEVGGEVRVLSPFSS